MQEVERGREKGARSCQFRAVGKSAGQAGSVELVVGDSRESESYCCRQVMRGSAELILAVHEGFCKLNEESNIVL